VIQKPKNAEIQGMAQETIASEGAGECSPRRHTGSYGMSPAPLTAKPLPWPIGVDAVVICPQVKTVHIVQKTKHFVA